MSSTREREIKPVKAPETDVSGRDWTSTARSFGDRYAALIGFAVMIAVFWILRPHTFGTWDNATAILEQAAPTVILGVGLTLVLSTGAYDLQFTGIIAIASLGGILLMREDHVNTFVAIVVTIAIGGVGGLIGGALVAMDRASPFIVTLAMGSVWTGLSLGLSKGENITEIDPGYLNLTLKHVAGIPLSAIIALVVAIFMWALMRFTVFGRQAQTIGSNKQAARLAGIRIPMTRIGAFVVSGICAAIASVLLCSSTGGFNPSVGEGLFIPPFVAAFFGVAVLASGRFNVFGTVIGALFTGTLETGLVILGTQAWVGTVLVGVVLLLILMLASKQQGDQA
jgi:ribose transport system permease protein